MATVAMIVAAISGPTIVLAVASSQTTAVRSARKPSRNHEVNPRSRSHPGAANETLAGSGRMPESSVFIPPSKSVERVLFIALMG